jgi:hypothetical protein
MTQCAAPASVPTNADDETSYNNFDIAAAQAENELGDLDGKTAADIAIWWKRWFGQAGHKRLGRILVKKAKAISQS